VGKQRRRAQPWDLKGPKKRKEDYGSRKMQELKQPPFEPSFRREPEGYVGGEATGGLGDREQQQNMRRRRVDKKLSWGTKKREKEGVGPWR